MRYWNVTDHYDIFHDLLVSYYREGEDADTPQAELDAFVEYLFRLCRQGEIEGCILAEQEKAAGFVLWYRDTPGSAFSHLPGYGTILEIGVQPASRGKGLGVELARFAEDRLRAAGADRFYVCAYGPAERFWLKMGYTDSGRLAENGLKLFEK